MWRTIDPLGRNILSIQIQIQIQIQIKLWDKSRSSQTSFWVRKASLILYGFKISLLTEKNRMRNSRIALMGEREEKLFPYS